MAVTKKTIMKYINIVVVLFISASSSSQTTWTKVLTFDRVDVEKIAEAEKSLSELLNNIDNFKAETADRKNKEIEKENKSRLVRGLSTLPFVTAEEIQTIDKDGCIFGYCSETGISHYGGNFYKGGFKYNPKTSSNVYHGFGCFLQKDNSFYLGEFEYGAKSGFGIMIYSSQYYYIGNWKNNNWEGNGKRVHFGEIKEGLWSTGLFIQPLNDCVIAKSFSYAIPTYITKANALNFKGILNNHNPGLKDFEAIFYTESADKLWTKYTKNITTLVSSDLVGYDLKNYDLQCLTLEDVVRNWKLNNLKFKNNSLQLLRVTFYKRSIGGGELNLYFFKSIESEKIVLIDLIALNSMK